MLASSTAAGARTPMQDLASIVRDPLRFSRGLLKHDPWGVQGDILRSVAEHPRTAVKACHASGKTFGAADALMWWTTRYHDGVVVTTAPTWTQVERLLWGEVHKSAANGRIRFPKLNKTELPLGPENYALGLSTNEGVRFQGWHGRILIILDEAPGVLPEIYDAIEGIRAGGHVHLLWLGNPTLPSGAFYEAFTKNAARWQTFTISAFDTPNLAGYHIDNGKSGPDRYVIGHTGKGTRNLLECDEAELADNPRPYLITRAYVREKYEEWGPTHPLWASKVLGQFPTNSEDVLITLAWADAARAVKASEELLFDAGLDVAGPGEAETVLTVRRGPNVVFQRGWAKADPRGDVLQALDPFRSRLRNVNVDDVGIGYYLLKHLEDRKIPARGVNVGLPARNRERFANRKAELYWGLRDRFKAGDVGGLSGPAGEKTISQITGIGWGTNARGQTVIEGKDAMRARGVPSPDYAESLMLAYAPPPAPEPKSEDYAVIRR